jgi:hypothetical protein
MIERTETVVERRTVRLDVPTPTASDPLYALLTEQHVEVTLDSITEWSRLSIPRELARPLHALLAAVVDELDGVPISSSDDSDTSRTETA